MFCSNCGKQIPDNNKFCNHCGAQQTANSYMNAASPQQESSAPSAHTTPPATPQPAAQQTVPQQPVYTPQQQFQPPRQKPPKKKGVGIVVSLLVILVAFLLGMFVIAPAITKGAQSGKVPADSSSRFTFQQPGNQPNDTASKSGTTNKAPNPDYQAIFDGSYIVHSPMFFNLETASFARKDNDGTIICCDYGYKDDQVIQMVETTYIPVSGYTDAQKAELESKAKANAAAYDGMNALIVKYDMGTRYFSITVKYGGLDRTDYRDELVKAGVLKGNAPISMAASEQQQLADGAVKK